MSTCNGITKIWNKNLVKLPKAKLGSLLIWQSREIGKIHPGQFWKVKIIIKAEINSISSKFKVQGKGKLKAHGKIQTSWMLWKIKEDHSSTSGQILIYWPITTIVDTESQKSLVSPENSVTKVYKSKTDTTKRHLQKMYQNNISYDNSKSTKNRCHQDQKDCKVLRPFKKSKLQQVAHMSSEKSATCLLPSQTLKSKALCKIF